VWGSGEARTKGGKRTLGIGPWAPGCQDAVPHTSSVSYLGSGEMHKKLNHFKKTTRTIQMLGTDEGEGMRGRGTRRAIGRGTPRKEKGGGDKRALAKPMRRRSKLKMTEPSSMKGVPRMQSFRR